MDINILRILVTDLIDSARQTNELAWQTATSLDDDAYDAVCDIINDIKDGVVDDVDEAMELLMDAVVEDEDDDD